MLADVVGLLPCLTDGCGRSLMADDAAAISYRIDEDGKFGLDDEGEQIERARSSWYSPEWRRHYEYALTDAQRAKLLQIIENAV